MPGRAPRSGAARLSGKQSRAASNHLLQRWTPQSVWEGQEKQALTDEINKIFVDIGEAPCYSRRKLEDWLSNARYRANCQKRTGPASWTVESRATARAKARDAKRASKRAELTQRHRNMVMEPAESRVQELLRSFEQNAASPSASDADIPGPVRTTSRARQRSAEFASIRNKFESEKYGRSDLWVSHRGFCVAPSMVGCNDAHFVSSGLDGPRPPEGPVARPNTDHDGGKLPTFLTIPGLPFPPRCGVGAEDDAAESGVHLLDASARELLEGMPLAHAMASIGFDLPLPEEDATSSNCDSGTASNGSGCDHCIAQEVESDLRLVSPKPGGTDKRTRGSIDQTVSQTASDSIEMVDLQDVAEKDHRANSCTAARAVSMQISDPESTPTLLTRPISWGAGLDLLAQHPAVSELILAAVDEDLESTAAFLAAAVEQLPLSCLPSWNDDGSCMPQSLPSEPWQQHQSKAPMAGY